MSELPLGALESDVQFILGEVLRFARMGRKEWRQLGIADLLTMFPRPDGMGSIMVGRAAYLRLYQMVERAIGSSQYAGRLDPDKAMPIAAREFVATFSKPLTYDDAFVQAMLDRVIAEAAKACTDQTHHFPCHLIGDQTGPKKFAIGPVTFTRTAVFMANKQRALGRYLAEGGNDEQAQSRIRRDIEEAQEYYGLFGWVASVRVPDCDPSTSKALAELAVRAAVNILQVLLGAAFSDRMRIAGPPLGADRRYHLSTSKAGRVELGFTLQWTHGNGVGPSWWTKVRRDYGSVLTFGGRAVQSVLLPTKPMPVARRWLDAVTWYGEGVADRSPAVQVVKYVTAIERLLLTNDQASKVKDRLSRRIAALTFSPEVMNHEEIREGMRGLYKLRSEILHGTLSPFDRRIIAGVGSAEALSRDLVLIWAERHGEHFDQPELDEKALERYYDGFVADVERYLASRRDTVEA